MFLGNLSSLRLHRRFQLVAVFAASLCAFAHCVDSYAESPSNAQPVVQAPAPKTLAFCGQRNADGDFIRPFADADLAKIEATQEPVSLRFAYSDVDDGDLERLAGNPFVCELSLQRCPNLTDAAVEIASRFPNLRDARFLDQPQWKNPNFAALAACKELRSLWLQSCGALSEESLNGLGKCVELRSLRLVALPVSDANLAQIAKLSALQALVVTNCPTLTDAGIAEIAKLTELNSLMLKDVPELSDAGVAPLSGLSRLRFLAINGSPRLTEKGLATFAALPITILSAPEQFFSDEKIDALTQFPKVRVLFVEQAPGAKITLDGLLKLKSLDNLHRLFVEEYESADVAAFKALQRETPILGIVVSIAGAPEDKKNVVLPPRPPFQKSADGNAAQAQEAANR